MDNNKYYIKPGYMSQSANHTLSTIENQYWTQYRIIMSKYYQYSVYAHATKLIYRYKINNVIDVGCGVATKLIDLIFPICSNVTGVDQQEAVDYCQKEYKKGTFFVDNLETPNLDLYGKYELIICADVIEHLLDPDPLIDLFKQIANDKRAWLVLSTPERDILRGKDCLRSEKREHVREWNASEFNAYLRSHGLGILEQRMVFHVKPDLRKQSIRREYWELLKARRGLKSQQLVVATYSRNK